MVFHFVDGPLEAAPMLAQRVTKADHRQTQGGIDVEAAALRVLEEGGDEPGLERIGVSACGARGGAVLLAEYLVKASLL